MKRFIGKQLLIYSLSCNFLGTIQECVFDKDCSFVSSRYRRTLVWLYKLVFEVQKESLMTVENDIVLKIVLSKEHRNVTK